MRVYVDADIVIWHLRGMPPATELLRALEQSPENELWMSAIQRSEVVFFMHVGEEATTMRVLRRFQTHPVTEEIVDLAATYFRRWNPSHGVDENDAILAATVALTGGKVVTQNMKHFPMTDVVVERGWD